MTARSWVPLCAGGLRGLSLPAVRPPLHHEPGLGPEDRQGSSDDLQHPNPRPSQAAAAQSAVLGRRLRPMAEVEFETGRTVMNSCPLATSNRVP
jgi:hypothetical protein